MSVTRTAIGRKAPQWSRLSERLRPRALNEFFGQRHLLGRGAPIGDALQRARLHSFVAWGPPGSGKSSLIRVLARELGLGAIELSGAASGISQFKRLLRDEASVLLLDEAHCLSPESQQLLLAALDRGHLLVLATTSSEPHRSLIAPLLSRLAIYRFQPLDAEALRGVLTRALQDKETGFANSLELEAAAEEYLLNCAGGDARIMLDALERMANAETSSSSISLDRCLRALHPDRAAYPSGGLGHHDVVTAFVKSMRGSDPDATLYWLAAMLEAGEDVTFIARRVAICAAEDVGLADPFALVMANSMLDAAAHFTHHELHTQLAHAAVYVATAPKSAATSRGLGRAQHDLRARGAQPVPLHLRQRTLRGTPEGNYSQGSAFSVPQGQVLFPQYLPDSLTREVFYEPGDTAVEARIRERLRSWWPERY